MKDRLFFWVWMRRGAWFLVALFLAFFYSCALYPTIPKLEQEKPAATKGKTNETAHKEKNNIREIFQRKAVSYVAHIQAKKRNYEIGPQDVLKISVWDNPDLIRDVTVSEDGNFSYPLIGNVHANGLTVSQLEEKIRSRLAGRFIVDPQVTITIEQYKSKHFFVLGEVARGGSKGGGPGTYPLIGRMTLLDALSVAGGISDQASDEIVIIRPKKKRKGPTTLNKAEKDEIIKVNLRCLLNGDTSRNILIQPNDTIYIPKAAFFFVYGEVKKPGRYLLHSGMTVLKAITMAGGITEKAAINSTILVRETADGKKKKIKAKMTDPVRPQDIIIVKESFF